MSLVSVMKHKFNCKNCNAPIVVLHEIGEGISGIYLDDYETEEEIKNWKMRSGLYEGKKSETKIR